MNTPNNPTPTIVEALKAICSEFAQTHPLIIAASAALLRAEGESREGAQEAAYLRRALDGLAVAIESAIKPADGPDRFRLPSGRWLDGHDGAEMVRLFKTMVGGIREALAQPHHPTARVEAVARMEALEAENKLLIQMHQHMCDLVGQDVSQAYALGRSANLDAQTALITELEARLTLTAQQHPGLGGGGPTEEPDGGRSEGPQEASPDGMLVPAHQDTNRMVRAFCAALGDKLARAELKYGYTNGWLTDDWEDECRTQLIAHVAKGDPLDVAAYAAFCWARGWSTTTPAGEGDEALLAEADSLIFLGSIDDQAWDLIRRLRDHLRSREGG